MSGFTLLLILWVIAIFVASAQGRAKNRAGFLYGLLLSWVGVLILAVLPAIPDALCPHCREGVSADAAVCPHCQRELPQSAQLTTG